jgi:hypothetical protein
MSREAAQKVEKFLEDEHQTIIGKVGKQPDQTGETDRRRAKERERQHRIGAACLRQQERRACHGEDTETSNDKRVRSAEFATLDESEGESSKRRTHAGVHCFWAILITTSSQSSLNVRFGPNATELLHRREMTRRA